jgi:hypothetical protein
MLPKVRKSAIQDKNAAISSAKQTEAEHLEAILLNGTTLPKMALDFLWKSKL